MGDRQIADFRRIEFRFSCPALPDMSRQFAHHSFQGVFRTGCALQLAVHEFSVHDHRNRSGFVDVIATHLEQVLVQDDQVGLLAHFDRPQLVRPANW